MEVRPGYKQTEAGVIPEDWEATPLKGKIGIAHGFAFASQHFASYGPFRLTTPGHFYEVGGFRDIGEKQKYYIGPVPSEYVLQPGDVIVAMTEQADGLLGSAAVIPKEHGYLHNQRLGRVKILSSEIELNYLVNVFNSPSYRAKVRETAAGTKVKHTSPEKLLEIAIRLPPSPEQCAIAAALSDVDGLLAKLDQFIAKKRDLKQAAMQQLLTGQTRLPGFSGEWEVKRLGDMVAIRKGQLITENDAICGEVPVIAGGKKPAYFHNMPNRAGKTITVSASGASAGYVAFFNMPIFASDCSTISEGKEYSIEFIYFQLQLKQAAIYKAQTGGAQPHIHAVDLMPLEIGSPSFLEQAAIATVLSDMDTELATLEARRDKTRALKQGTMQELLTGRIRLV